MSDKHTEIKTRKRVVPKSAWKPGQSGNPKGRPPMGESLTETMRAFLNEVPEGQELTYKQMFVKKSYQKAYEGDPTFAKLVWNYIDGMPIQKQEITGKDGTPFADKIIFTLKKSDGIHEEM